MSDTRFEREKPALEQMPPSYIARVRVISDARFMIERHKARLNAAEPSDKPRTMPFNVLAQVQQDESEAPRILNNLSDQPDNPQGMSSAQIADMSEDLGSVRRMVEESYEAA